MVGNQTKIGTKAKKKTKKGGKDTEASTSSQSNNPSTNGQVTTTSTDAQNITTSVPECDDLERSKKIKKIKSVRIFIVDTMMRNESRLILIFSYIFNFLQKLEQISKLKEQQVAGKQLEINQLDKIKKEADLIKELEELAL